MNLPYSFRIMACLPGDTPVELFRSQVKYSQKAWMFWTRDMDAAWTCWCEHTQGERFLLSERPRCSTPSVGRVDRLPFTREEVALLPELPSVGISA